MSVWTVAKLVTVGVSMYLGAIGTTSAQPNSERTELVRAGSTTIHVIVRGQGDPIVFIPSLGRGVEDFDDLSRRVVQAGYQAILPDPRGIGGSKGPLTGITLHNMADDVAAVIRSTGGGRPATVVGHALGNRVARMLASDHPNLTKQVILLAPGGMVPPTPEIIQAGTRAFDATIPRDDRVAALQRAFFAPSNDAKVWENGWHFDVVPAQRAAMNRTPLGDWWAGGVAPILALQGTDDINAVRENAESLASEFPNRVTLVEISNAGHAMLPEQPERIAAAILTYLRR
jgi:pimeloyl-ACP methyl ester carboxylesterase